MHVIDDASVVPHAAESEARQRYGGSSKLTPSTGRAANSAEHVYRDSAWPPCHKSGSVLVDGESLACDEDF